MPIPKKQKGGIIDDPKNCNNDSTPIDLDEIKENSDVIYVGDKLEGDKYNCFKPSELKDIILQAIKDDKIAENPLNRQPLEDTIIQRIKDMYPDDFEEDEEDDEDDEPELILRANLSLETITPILANEYPATSEGDRRQTRQHERRIKPLKDILKEAYKSDIKWNQWYNNPNIPTDYKNAMINYFKLVDSFSEDMVDINKNLMTVELMELLNYPINNGINFRFHYLYRDFPNIKYIVGIVITYQLDEEESTERLEELNIENTNEWSVYKICGMAVEGEFSNSKENMSDLITKMLGYDNNNKLIVVAYDSDHSNPEDNYSKFVFDTLDFYQVGAVDSERGMSRDYLELYSTYDSNNNKLYVGKNDNVGGGKKKTRKLKYKKRVSKKSSKKKSKKSSKKRSPRRK